MKRKFLVTLLLIFCFMLPVGLTSCGGDDKNNNTENQSQNQSQAQYCTVTFDSDGGSEVASKSVEKGTNVQEPTEPTKEHYTFEGWYYGDDKWSFIGYTVNQNITLKAKWTLTNYTITYNLDGGTNNENNPKTYTIETKTITLSNPTKEHCDFAGWYKDSSFTTKINEIQIDTYDNIEIFAKWNDKRFIIYGTTITKLTDYGRNLSTIEISSSITSISEGAFSECYNLADVYYEGTLSDWCKISFSNEYSNPMYNDFNNDKVRHFYLKNSNGEYEELTEIIIPSDITEIKNYTFARFNNVTKITIPESVISIGGGAFGWCSSLTNVYYTGTLSDWCKISFSSNPMSNSSMYQKMYFYLKNSSGEYEMLTEIEISDDITELKDYTFAGFNNVTKVTIPNSVTWIGSSAFSGCSSLISITIPSSVTSIGNYAFNYCSSLTDITIPNSVTSIGDRAFYYCKNLESVTIPNSVTSIGRSTFSGCSSLTSIEIPSSVTSIGHYAFDYCSNLTSVTIPSSVTSIGDGVFGDCNSLEYNEYDNALYLGNSDNPYLVLVKAKDKNITSCTINSNTRFIHSYAFSYCSKLTSITIPNSVTSIGSGAFSGCSSLEYNKYDNALYLGTSENPYLILVKAKDKNITSCTINSNTRFIHSDAFEDCFSLTSIEIPDSVTCIGYSAFEGCISLKSAVFENSNGWELFYLYSGSKLLSSSELSNSSTAANYLEYTYSYYSWHRS